MKNNIKDRIRFITILLLLILNCGNVYSIQQAEFPDLSGPYFGQQIPGLTPQIFAAGIIYTEAVHSTPTFSPDCTEMVWAEMAADWENSTIYFSRMIDNQWTEPEAAPFGSNYIDDVPTYSPDGQKLFFNSDRSWPANGGSEGERIWYVSKVGENSWSQPQPIGLAVNNHGLHWQTSVDNNGTIYFGSAGSPSYGEDDIFYSEFVNDVYQTPVNIGPSINSPENESMPFIDPEGRFIMFFRSGIWISRKNTDGSWADAERISDQYPGVMGPCAKITPDGLYLFFMKYMNGQNNICWVDAQVIQEFITSVNSDGNFQRSLNNFTLYQNYPNPFNPTTNISYSISEYGFVQLIIFDILGNEKAVLVYENQSPGSYTVQFDGKAFSSGIYIYQLFTKNSHPVGRKMCLIK
ncbi:T9SS type A sorting domain-containing protein [Bacteroidota bacterium]